MNWVDLTVLVVVGISAALAFMRGFVREVLGIAAWAGAAYLAWMGIDLLRSAHAMWKSRPAVAAAPPALDNSRPFRTALTIFVVVFIVLGYYGTQTVTPAGTIISQIGTLIYFSFFLLMPWYSAMDKTKPVPDRVTM